MRIVHLTASTFFGGPERQMLGLARALSPDDESRFLCFREHGRCDAFLAEIRQAGFDGIELQHDTPHLRAAVREIARELADADVLITHGYKSNLLGRPAARRAGVPIISVSRGWTGENTKVHLYEALDRFHLRFVDRVVCVSEGQARKVRRARVSAARISVIRNAARLNAFASPDPSYREKLRELLPAVQLGDCIVCAAGRLSPEKGFQVLVESAAEVVRRNPAIRFVLFGEGALRETLTKRIAELGLSQHFILAGFRSDLDGFLPWIDMMVLPSFTEGLPNVALEASAASKPVIATRVGGNPEVVRDGATGYLVPSGDPTALAEKVLRLGGDAALRERLGNAARDFMRAEFTFEAQARAYRRLFAEVKRKKREVVACA